MASAKNGGKNRMTDSCYTTGEIAARLGCSTGHVRKQIAAGCLVSNAKGHRHSVHRQEIVRWLIAIDWPASQIRTMFPLSGPLATVGLRPAFRPALCMESPRHFDGLLDLGIATTHVRPWGIVVDLPSLGTSATTMEFSRFSNKADRPILIALVGDDGGSDSVFDVLIPDGLSPGKIAQRVRAVRPWGK